MSFLHTALKLFYIKLFFIHAIHYTDISIFLFLKDIRLNPRILGRGALNPVPPVRSSSASPVMQEPNHLEVGLQYAFYSGNNVMLKN